MDQPFTQAHIGAVVTVQRAAKTPLRQAVVVDVNEVGCPCVAFLRKDGTISDAPRVWTGLYRVVILTA